MNSQSNKNIIRQSDDPAIKGACVTRPVLTVASGNKHRAVVIAIGSKNRPAFQ